MPFATVGVTYASQGFVAIVQHANYQSLGYSTQNITANVSTAPNNTFNLVDTFPVAATFNFSNQPAQTDVEGITMLDFTGGDGTGNLGISAVQVHKWSDAGSSVAVRVGTATTAPSGSRYLAGVVATYLQPLGTRTVANDLLSSNSSVMIRDGAGGAQPFSAAANSTFTVNSFMNVAPADISAGHTVFTFGDASNAGQIPQYSISTLTIRHTTWYPKQSCEATNPPSTTTRDYTQWIVYRPHLDDTTACSALSTAPASCESFSLPTLPSTFPYATAGAQRQSGFEQYVGGGTTCTGAGAACPVAGETCVQPVGTTLAFRCMANDGTDNYQETYYWQLEDRILGLAPAAVAAGSADLTQWRPGLTQSSSNGAQWQ
jgi:hypothetical protein